MYVNYPFLLPFSSEQQCPYQIVKVWNSMEEPRQVPGKIWLKLICTFLLKRSAILALAAKFNFPAIGQKGPNLSSPPDLKSGAFLQCEMMRLVKQSNWVFPIMKLGFHLLVLGAQPFCWCDCLKKIKVFVEDVTSQDKWSRLMKSVTMFGNSSRASWEGSPIHQHHFCWQIGQKYHFYGIWNMIDQHRNPNINNRDHGRLLVY